VQVAPIQPTLKAPGTKRLKLKYDKLLSFFGFNCNLRLYTQVEGANAAARDAADLLAAHQSAADDAAAAAAASHVSAMAEAAAAAAAAHGMELAQVAASHAVSIARLNEAGPGRCCPTRHRHACEPSLS